ncbi:hypothetical protein BDW62DRAFT_184221 [Aspergillus aurantiobrunneus]
MTRLIPDVKYNDQGAAILNIEDGEQSQLGDDNLDSSTHLLQNDQWWTQVPAQSVLTIKRFVQSPVFVLVYVSIWLFVLLPMIIFGLHGR